MENCGLIPAQFRGTVSVPSSVIFRPSSLCDRQRLILERRLLFPRSPAKHRALFVIIVSYFSTAAVARPRWCASWRPLRNVSATEKASARRKCQCVPRQFFVGLAGSFQSMDLQ
jgi:hypothetical protein